jgi:hypothetical protein
MNHKENRSQGKQKDAWTQQARGTLSVLCLFGVMDGDKESSLEICKSKQDTLEQHDQREAES